MTIILFYYILVQKQDLHTNIHTKCIYATNTQSLWMLIVFQAILNLSVENLGNNLFSTYIFFVSICFYFFLISSKTETSD
jgi:hypothetical protein